MLISILNLVYREFLKSALPGMARREVWRRHSSPSSPSAFSWPDALDAYRKR
jgi:hypothetical protein